MIRVHLAYGLSGVIEARARFQAHPVLIVALVRHQRARCWHVCLCRSTGTRLCWISAHRYKVDAEGQVHHAQHLLRDVMTLDDATLEWLCEQLRLESDVAYLGSLPPEQQLPSLAA